MLTDRQQQLLDFLRQYHSENGLMPSTREIQNHFGFASQTAAVSHLRALEKKGVIQRVAGKARALVFPEQLEREEICRRSYLWTHCGRHVFGNGARTGRLCIY